MSVDSKIFLITYLTGSKMPACLTEALPSLLADLPIRWQKTKTIEDLVSAHSGRNGGLAVFAVYEREDLRQLVKFMRLQEDPIQKKQICPIVFDYANSPKVSEFLRRSDNGLTILDRAATAKTFIACVERNFQTILGFFDPEPVLASKPAPKPLLHREGQSPFELGLSTNSNKKVIPVPGEKTDPRLRTERLKFLSHVSQRLAAKENRFNLLTKPAERLSYFKEAEETFCTAVVWTRQQEFRMDSRFYRYDAKSEKLFVTLSPQMNDAGFTKIVGREKNTVLFVYINTRRAPIFIATNALEMQAKDRMVGFPASQEIYEVQRRNYFRAQFLEDQAFTASIDFQHPSLPGNPSLACPIVNLSATGLAFVANVNEHQQLTRGQIINSIRFKVNSREFTTSALVRWSKPIGTATKKPGLLVGVQFETFDEDTTKELNLFALEQSYDYLRRYIDPAEFTDAPSA